MNSSIFSSRRIYARILLTIALGMSAVMATVLLTTYGIDYTSDTILGRILEARAALPQIVSDEDELMIFFGSSLTEEAFSPRQFDRALAEQGVRIKSFNFGFGGLNPFFQDYLSRRIRESFLQHDKRPKLALIEFNPFQTTITRRNRAVSLEESFLTRLASPEELLHILLRDPQRGVRLFTIRYLRNSTSAEMLTSAFGQEFLSPRPRTSLVENREIAERRRALGDELAERLEEDYPQYAGKDWVYDWRGAGPIPKERSAETLEIFHEYCATDQTDYRMENNRLNRIHSADIIDLNFDEVLVESFIRVVKNFQQFADHVEIVLLPKNTNWIKNPPEAVERMRLVLERIERETGAVIKNFQELDEIAPDMFSDTTHLNRYVGQVAFTDYLVEEYSGRLKEGACVGDQPERTRSSRVE